MKTKKPPNLEETSTLQITLHLINAWMNKGDLQYTPQSFCNKKKSKFQDWNLLSRSQRGSNKGTYQKLPQRSIKPNLMKLFTT